MLFRKNRIPNKQKIGMFNNIDKVKLCINRSSRWPLIMIRNILRISYIIIHNIKLFNVKDVIYEHTEKEMIMNISRHISFAGILEPQLTHLP